MRRTFYLPAIAGFLLSTAMAQADPPQIKGDYAVTGSANCVVAQGGFNAQLQPIPLPFPGGGISNLSFSIEGIRTFNGKGEGTVKATTVSVSTGLTVQPHQDFPVITGSASSSMFTLSFTYNVQPDGVFTTELVPGTFVSTVLTGPNAGVTSALDKLSLTGLISNNGQTLTLASVEPVVETVTSSNGNVSYRVCHRSRVLTRMNPRKDD